MALFPWRLQGDIKKGETDPMVTVFIGAERAVMDSNGEPTAETFIQQDTRDPATMKLSEVAAALANPTVLQAARPPKPTL